MALAAWRHPSDPQIYGDFEVDARRLLSFIETVRESTGVHVTVTHLVGRAVAVALAEHPDLNTRLDRGRFVPRDSVDVFFVVALEGGRDLSGVKVEHADRKSAVEIAEELSRRAGRIRSGSDVEFGKGKQLLDSTPLPLLRIALGLAAWLSGDKNVDLRRFGVPPQVFGSAMVSSVAMFGVRHAYGPLSPFYRVPLLALVSEVETKPVVEEGGEIVARPLLTVTATIDHRYYDGSHAARLARGVRAYLEDPEAFEPAVDTADAVATKG
jgi:pyruvate dehydrogenase E2 component (dihydrolipoamide acetyltransferase)